MLEPFPDRGAIPFRRRRDPGGVVNAVVAFMRQNARELFVGYIALVAPFTIVASLSGILMLNRFGDMLGQTDTLREDPDLIVALFGPSYAILVISTGLAFAFSQGAVAGYVRLYREGEAGAITPSLLWSDCKWLVFSVIGMYLLLVLAMIPVFILGGALIGVLPALLGVLLWLWLLAALMPIVHVWFAERMTDSPNVFTAIGRAFALVRGEWFRSFVAIFLTWVVVLGAWFVLAMIIQMVIGLVGLNSTIEDPASITRAMAVWLVPFQILGSLVYIPPAIAAFFLQGSLAEDLDGPNLDDEFDLLESGVEAAPTTSWEASAAPASPPLAPEAPTPPAPPPPASGDAPSSPGGFRGGGFS